MTTEQDATTEWVHSDGGVSLEVPSGWVVIVEDEHLSALVEPPVEPTLMAPTCIVHDAPGHLDLPTWWSTLQVGSVGALLLDVEEHPAGFGAVHAVTADELSATGYTRIVHLPGRSLVVTVSFASDCTSELLPTARSVAGSARVEGLA